MKKLICLIGLHKIRFDDCDQIIGAERIYRVQGVCIHCGKRQKPIEYFRGKNHAK